MFSSDNFRDNLVPVLTFHNWETFLLLRVKGESLQIIDESQEFSSCSGKDKRFFLLQIYAANILFHLWVKNKDFYVKICEWLAIAFISIDKYGFLCIDMWIDGYYLDFRWNRMKSIKVSSIRIHSCIDFINRGAGSYPCGLSYNLTCIS